MFHRKRRSATSTGSSGLRMIVVMQVLFQDTRGGTLAEPGHDGTRDLVGFEFGISGADRQRAHCSEHLQLGLVTQRRTGEAVVRDCVGTGNLSPFDQAEEFIDNHFVIRIRVRPRCRDRKRQWESAKSGCLSRLPSMICSA